MRRVAVFLLFCAIATFAPAQASSQEQREPVVWKPQLLYKFTDETPFRATVHREMIANLRISDVTVSLEADSQMEILRQKFGGEIGAEGDAAESLRWLCLHGSDAGGPWVLWLESDEIDGPYIGGFQWSRVPRSSQFDRRCAALPDSTTIELPDNLRLDIAESDVRRILGKPSIGKGSAWIYEHEHDETIRGEVFNSSNTVVVQIRDGRLWAIKVNKSTTN